MSDMTELRKLVAHGMSVPSGLAGRMIDHIAELEAEVERLQVLRDEDREDMQRMSDQLDYYGTENAKLQKVVHAATAYLTYPNSSMGRQALEQTIAALDSGESDE